MPRRTALPRVLALAPVVALSPVLAPHHAGHRDRPDTGDARPPTGMPLDHRAPRFSVSLRQFAGLLRIYCRMAHHSRSLRIIRS